MGAPGDEVGELDLDISADHAASAKGLARGNLSSDDPTLCKSNGMRCPRGPTRCSAVLVVGAVRTNVLEISRLCWLIRLPSEMMSDGSLIPASARTIYNQS